MYSVMDWSKDLKSDHFEMLISVLCKKMFRNTRMDEYRQATFVEAGKDFIKINISHYDDNLGYVAGYSLFAPIVDNDREKAWVLLYATMMETEYTDKDLDEQDKLYNGSINVN